MNKLSHWLYQISRGWVAITAVLVFLVFSILILPKQNFLAEEYSQGTGSPDTSLFYDGNQLYQMAEKYGEEGRQQYLKARWTFDLAFPFVYGLFLVTSVSWALNKTLEPTSGWRVLNVVPLVAVLADFLENTMTSFVFACYPAHSWPGEILAPIFTPLKWLLVSTSFLLLLTGLVLQVFRSLTRHK